ncbi:MAG: type II toxin-antitoxin system MqsR family toxin [Pseudomonadota bacterium]
MSPNIKHKAHYPFPLVQDLVRHGHWISTKTVNMSAVALGFHPQTEIPKAILRLTNHHLIKSVEDTRIKGRWQDAYSLSYEGHQLYIKFTVDMASQKVLLVLSFKENIS